MRQNVIMTVASLASNSGGPSRTSTSLCTALASQGVRVELLSVDVGKSLGEPILPNRDLVRTEFVSGHHSQRMRLLWAPKFKGKLEQRLRSSGAGLIHDNGVWLPTNHAVARVARKWRVPLIVSPRGMLEPWSLRNKSWKKRFIWALYQRANLQAASLLHATSEMEARNLRQLGLQQPVAVIPNGVEMPASLPSGKTTQSQRTVLFLSRIHPKKGLLNLVNAWAQLRPNGWRILIAGPDEDRHRTEVQALIVEHKLSQEVSFVGSADGEAKWQLYREAQLFILPSFSENFGVVVAEALACGVPVITTKATPWKALEQQRCGWWIDVGVEPLAHALAKAISISDAEREEMGKRGRQLVEQNFSWPGIGRNMRTVYEWVLGNGTKPDCVLID